jgi:hypothetical protein
MMEDIKVKLDLPFIFDEITINVLGTDYTIKEENLSNNDGQCDESIKTITLDSGLNREPSEFDKKNLKSYKRKVLRHEIIHAIMEECGMSAHDDLANERFVDWVAIMYPKIKAIFEKLNIES